MKKRIKHTDPIQYVIGIAYVEDTSYTVVVLERNYDYIGVETLVSALPLAEAELVASTFAQLYEMEVVNCSNDERNDNTCGITA